MTLDPERLSAAISAAAGGLLYGLYHLITLWSAGQTPSRDDYVRAGLNVAGAIAAGALLAYFLTPAAVAALPFTTLRDPTAVAFILGALGWELLPIAFKLAKARLRKAGEA